MLRRALGGIAVFAISSCFAFASQAQDIKLYAFSSGALTIGKGVLQNLGPVDPPIQIPVGFFVIKHPKGNVLFDTGNNDKIIKDPSYWGASFNALKPVNTPDVAIDTQLRRSASSPTTSSMSWSATCIWIMAATSASSRTRRSSCRGTRSRTRSGREPGTGGPYMIGDVMPLRVAATPTIPTRSRCCSSRVTWTCSATARWSSSAGSAHTPGSQMMTVRLKNTGLIILTGDNVYFRENVEKSLPPNIVLAYNPGGFLTAYEWIRMMMATEKADFFTAHDPDAFKAMKKAPEFYD